MLQSTYKYSVQRAAHPNWVNAFAVISREHFLAFDVQSAAPRLTQPFLQIHGPNALNPAWAERVFNAVPGQKTRVTIQSKGQTDVYDDPTILATAADHTADFLAAQL